MPLVSGTQLLRQAHEAQFAVGAFNADNMEVVQAVIAAAELERAPVILQVSPPTIRYAGLAMAAGMVRLAAERSTAPVALHLDHGSSLAQCIQCIEAGFTSLMYDGSRLPFEENVARTAEIVAVAHAADLPVEAELGQVLSDGASPADLAAGLTDPGQAQDFVQRCGCDALAVAVGSVHGMQESQAELDIDRLRAISRRAAVPLVLHGGSGVRPDSVTAAIEAGVCKINIGTYLKQGFSAVLRLTMSAMLEEVDFRRFLAPARDEVTERVREKIRLFGASNRAGSHGC